MLILSDETLTRLDDIQIDRDIRGIAQWVYGQFEPWFVQMGAAPHDVTRSVRHIQQWSEAKALRRNKEIRILAVMSITQGAFFHSDPRFSQRFNRAARRFELAPDARIDALYAAFEGWRNDVLGPDGWQAIAARTAEFVMNAQLIETMRPAQIADHILPAQSGWVDKAANARFLEAVVAEGKRRSLPTRRHHACHLALSVILGYRWADDPKLIHLAQQVLKQHDPNAMARAVAQILTGNDS